MTDATVLQIGFSPDNRSEDPESKKLSVRVVQKYQGGTDDVANLGDLRPMLDAVLNGKSAFSYIYDICPYITITDGVVTITLTFYAYPTNLDMHYRLTPGAGILTSGNLITQPRSMDILIANSDTYQMDEVFTGTVKKQMPYFNSDGSEIEGNVAIEFSGATIHLSEPVTTALRLDGETSCYEHTLIMQFAKKNDQGNALSVTDLTNSITAQWTDENGDLQTETIPVTIPPCVTALLEACEDEIPVDPIATITKRLVVYYSTCDGKVIDTHLFEDEESVIHD